MTPTLDIPTLPPPVRIPSTAPSPFPGWTPSPYNTPAPVAPAAKTIKPFPFVPSDWWDGIVEVELQFENPRCAGWRGADKLNLRQRKAGAVLYVTVTLVELMKLIIWSWEHK